VGVTHFDASVSVVMMSQPESKLIARLPIKEGKKKVTNCGCYHLDSSFELIVLVCLSCQEKCDSKDSFVYGFADFFGRKQPQPDLTLGFYNLESSKEVTQKISKST